MRSFRLPAFAVLVTATLLIDSRPLAASSQGVSEDVPVPGGTMALAGAIGVDPVPDRARFVAELARLLYTGTNKQHKASDSTFRRLVRYLNGDVVRLDASTDFVPIPLPAVTWIRAVFHRPIALADLFAEVMSDPAAALLAHGLAALDDETLQFFVDHPAVVTRLYEQDARVFAAFAGHFHIHDNRVVPPGGDRAAPLWEALLNEKVAEPDRFMRELFAKDEGRIAYLYDVIGHLDSSRAAFALGFWMEDASVRVARFKALASAAASMVRGWRADERPFTRPPHDLLSMLSRVQVAATGRPGFPTWRAVWARAFAGGDLPAERSWVLEGLEGGPDVDAAWLAEATVLVANTRLRMERLDQFAFGHRAFATARAGAMPDIIEAIRAFPRFRMLMLTLERIGVSRPSVHVALARQAERLSGLETSRRSVALAQFQGAIALVARLTSVGTIDRAKAESLLNTLRDVPFSETRGYRGALASWLHTHLRPGLAAGTNMDDALMEALAGVPRTAPASLVSWEGRRYRFDLVASEARRLRRVRERLGGPSIDAALALHAIAQMFAGDTSAWNDVHAEALFELVDVVLGEALVSLSYAASLDQAEGSGRFAADVARRHDFGLAARGDKTRVPAAWTLPTQLIEVGAPWRVKGSVLGLEIALAPLALRRINSDPLAGAPAILSTERDTFATSLALMSPFAMHDAARDAIAEAVARGQRLVEALAGGDGDLTPLAREIAMDGWRVRALQWTVVHDPRRVTSLFSMTELLYLGGGRDLDLAAWGMSAIASLGCICTRLEVPGLSTALIGRPQLGLMATTVADLNLRVAVMLRELQLPAALAKSVLAAAVQDFVDQVRPTDADDWLTLVRTAQGLSRERIEDYVSAAAAGGPLVPVTTEQIR